MVPSPAMAGEAPVDPAAGLLWAALTDLGGPSAAEAARLAEALREAGRAPGDPPLAVAALAALAYRRPELATPELLAAAVHGAGSEPAGRAAAAVLEGLAATPQAPLALEEVWRLFGPAPPAGLRRHRLDLLRAAGRWRPDLVPVERLLEVAGSLGAEEREGFLGEVLEPALLRDPARLSAATLERVERAFRGAGRLRYTLAALAGHPATPPALARRLQAAVVPLFPWREPAARALGGGAFRLLVVQNVVIGQGDELIRLGPLLQGLLTAHPGLFVSLVTPRPHLYDHPRVEPVLLWDRPAVAAALEAPADGLLELFEPPTPEVDLRPELHQELARLLARRAFRLVIQTDVGATHFRFRRVALDGHELAVPLGVHRRTARNVYDPCRRLLAELGLPWLPVASGTPGACDPLTGVASRDARRVWEALGGSGPRPVALVNPFGGQYEAKGFPRDRLEALAAELGLLVAQGYRAVVLPTGTPWGSGEVLDRLAALLPPAARRHVAIAPDPAAGDPRDAGRLGFDLGLKERPELRPADRVMRLFKHFASYADLVVAVEGWLGHLAAQLGRPLRLVLMAASFGPAWYPPGVRELSSGLGTPGAAEEERDLLDPAAPPPLPRRPRKGLLVASLEALGRVPAPAAHDALLLALRSHDFDVRAAAARGLGPRLPDPAAAAALVAALGDREPCVRRAAAETLLARGAPAEAGVPRPEVLRAHAAVARQDWREVVTLGEAALPALAAALAGDNDPVRRESRWAMAQLLAGRAAGRRAPQ